MLTSEVDSAATAAPAKAIPAKGAASKAFHSSLDIRLSLLTPFKKAIFWGSIGQEQYLINASSSTGLETPEPSQTLLVFASLAELDRY
jgi:hypothetical protein